MIFVQYDSSTKYLMVNCFPFDPVLGLGKTAEELKQEGYLLDSLPIPEDKPDKIAVLKFDDVNKILYYEYFNRPLTPEEELKQLKDQQMLMQKAIDDLIFGGAL